VRLLIIRPEPGASASAARAKAAGFIPMLLPFFEVRPRPWIAPQPNSYDALLLTSANAVRHAGAGLDIVRHLPVHTVGERTASAAREAGLNVTFVGRSDAMDAVNAAVDAGHSRLFWLAGEDHRDLALPRHIELDIATCYASEALSLPEDAREYIMAADAIALHSPRAARRFREAVTELKLSHHMITIAAFSSAIADAAGTGWGNIVIAHMANDMALLSELKSLDRFGSDMSRKKDSL
jgi:uroporphyrinogen-III synthase